MVESWADFHLRWPEPADGEDCQQAALQREIGMPREEIYLQELHLAESLHSDCDPGPDAAQWRLCIRDLPPEVRAEIRSLYAVRPWANLVVLFYPAAWALAIWSVERWPSWPVRAGGVLVMALCLQAMGSMMHEALHGNLFRQPLLDRWAGFLLAIPTLFACSAYRVAHLNHHRHTRTKKDQDEFSYGCRTRGQYVALFYVSFLIGSLLYMLLVPWKAYEMASAEHRRRIQLEYSIIFVIFAAAVTFSTQHGHLEWMLWYWLIPFLIAVLWANTRALAEHMGTPGRGDAVNITRTTVSNPVWSFLMLNLNYHLEHHLFPGVPWYNLPRIHKLLQPLYSERRAVLEKSYIGFAVRCLMEIPEPIEPLPRKARCSAPV
jgi:fatty acid desaturase